MNKRTFVFVLAALFIVVTVFGASSEAKVVELFEHYVIDTPEGWQVNYHKESNTYAFAAPGESMGLTASAFDSEAMSLDEAANSLMKELNGENMREAGTGLTFQFEIEGSERRAFVFKFENNILFFSVINDIEEGYNMLETFNLKTANDNSASAQAPDTQPTPQHTVSDVRVAEFFRLCQSGAISEIEAAIKQGADVNAVLSESGGMTVLIYVSSENNPDVLRVLIKGGANVNAKLDNGSTSLIMAASESNNPEVLRVLIEAGADINAKDKDGTTPLMYACGENSNPEFSIALIKAGADVNAKRNTGLTALMLAASAKSNTEVLNALIQAGADVNAKEMAYGFTPLLYAAQDNNNPEVLNALIKAGADVNARSNSGATALAIATVKNNAEVLKTLISGGVNVNAQTEAPTAMFVAAGTREPEIVSLLLEAGAEVAARDVLLAQYNDLLKDTDIVEKLKSKVK